MDLPKYRNSSKIGEDGITILKQIVESELNWIFRINHKEHDFGIDAYLDIITEMGQITGKSIAIQVKTGDSYFKEPNEKGWVFRGQMSHLNYYMNHDIPVVIVLVDEKNQKAYWCHCDLNATQKAGDNWKITVPRRQKINSESKKELEKFVSPVKDYVSQMEHYWAFNKDVLYTYRLGLIVDKPEILELNYSNIAMVFERLQVNPDLISGMKNKVDIWIHGYNDDPRELYEIEEVKNWISQLLARKLGWSYFLTTEEGASFLRLAFLCNIEFIKVKGSEHFVNGIKGWKVEINLKSGVPFLKKLFDDLNYFCDQHEIDDEINIEIVKGVTKYLAGDLTDELQTKHNNG